MRKTLLNCVFSLAGLILVLPVQTFAGIDLDINESFKQVFLQEEALQGLNDIPVEISTNHPDYTWQTFEISSTLSTDVYLGSNQYDNPVVFLVDDSGTIFTAVPNENYPLVDFFKIPLSQGTHQVLWGFQKKKIISYPSVQIPLQVLSPQAFDIQYGYAWLFGIFFLGATFLLMLYHLILFFITRDVSYFFYFGFILCASFFCISMNPYLAQMVYGKMAPTSGIPFFLGTLTLGFHLVLFRTIFNLGSYFAKMDTLFKWSFYIIAFCALVGLVGFIEASLFILIPFTAIFSLMMLWANIKLLAEISISAWFFLMGTSLFSISIIILLGMLVGWFPSTVFGLTIGLQMQLFYILGAIFWASALSARIAQMQKEGDEEQLENQRLKRKQEQELSTMLEEQNKILEEKVQDRTEKLQEKNKELELSIQTLQEAQDQLIEKEKMASLGQLTAGVAHEINNPINFISNGISNLQMNYQDLVDGLKSYLHLDPALTNAEVIREIQAKNKSLEIDEIIEENIILFKSINNGVDRTRKIVTGLSSFSGDGDEQVSAADINECLNSTLEILKNKIKNRIEIIKDYGAIPKVPCQESRINQVFLNILNNAVQAIEGDGSITIRTQQVDDSVNIRISDTGQGMDEATKRKIFDPFFTTKEIGVGTGLGLSISYKIIEQHNGSLTFESALGKGTTFIIELPVNQDNA